jgi:hypothetical protein
VTTTGSSVTRFDSVIVRGNRCPITEIQPIDVHRMKADWRLREAEEEARHFLTIRRSPAHRTRPPSYAGALFCRAIR